MPEFKIQVKYRFEDQLTSLIDSLNKNFRVSIEASPPERSEDGDTLRGVLMVSASDFLPEAERLLKEHKIEWRKA